MARYMLIRGWLDVYGPKDSDVNNEILCKKIESMNSEFYESYIKINTAYDHYELYMNGWHYPDLIVNWVPVITLGINVQVYAYDFFKDMILNLTKSNELDLEGRFFLSIEDEKDEEWIIQEHQLSIIALD